MSDFYRYAPTVDAVLISHLDMNHLGALPYAFGHLGLDCPVYMTLPVNQMGQLVMYDIFQSYYNQEEFDKFTLEHVDLVFNDKIVQLKHKQLHNCTGKGEGISFLGYNSGHTLGGTIWKITKDQEDYVYAVDYNHKKERHLNGCELFHITRPSLLITDSNNALITQAATRKDTERDIVDSILSTVRKDGNVLFPVDTASRVLELALLLDEVWQVRSLQSYRLVWLNVFAENVCVYAKSTLSWMSDAMHKQTMNSKTNPFQFKNVKIVYSIDELHELNSSSSTPMVVLSTLPGLTAGLSRDLFLEWAEEPKNAVVYTSRPAPDTISHQMLKNGIRELDLNVKKRIPLEGTELEEFLGKRRKERQEKQRLEQEAKQLAKAMGSDDSDDDSDGDEVTSAIHMVNVNTSEGRKGGSVAVKVVKHDIPMTTSHKTNFFKQASVKFPMFPAIETKMKMDDYGMVLRPDEFLVINDPTMGAVAAAAAGGIGGLIGDIEADPSGVMPMDEDKTADEEAANMEEMEDREKATKYIVEDLHLSVKCKIKFIDFEGLSDMTSMSTILQQMAPRQTVLVHGTEKATRVMSKELSSLKDFGKVVIPLLGEVSNVTSDLNIYQVRLADSLASSLSMQTYLFGENTYELSWFQGKLRLPATAPAAGKRTILPVLDPVAKKDNQGHRPVFVGELVMPRIRKALNGADIKTEFIGGVLVCDEIIAVRKGADGVVALEGPLCETYYKVRSIVYGQYAIV
ncbi:hypothetical protein SARC_11387 [Sphaeroforma arctica JP610]|uniref:Cleavage and polyadenylation specificity factor subunit 2 n=1 Tax=Sphaeroforma arctica JP610 TaxID=667725 RepID=A0A0L0FI24_9EUKA|nr:hypothetical protein SARC_11387 [Sphaeroforma arctica JP610]KNC76101.1 hypothetical protein SARC_11387 [Sphaeroforma arctica JP610]|eukprot:XP_014150003.1 hypothetical protein SARC_11387 [Sphaeroforma arctica JP610]